MRTGPTLRMTPSCASYVCISSGPAMARSRAIHCPGPYVTVSSAQRAAQQLACVPITPPWRAVHRRQHHAARLVLFSGRPSAKYV